MLLLSDCFSVFNTDVFQHRHTEFMMIHVQQNFLSTLMDKIKFFLLYPGRYSKFYMIHSIQRGHLYSWFQKFQNRNPIWLPRFALKDTILFETESQVGMGFPSGLVKSLNFINFLTYRLRRLDNNLYYNYSTRTKKSIFVIMSPKLLR